MAQFLDATLSRGEIGRILTNAKYTIIVISPYMKIHDDLITRLMDAGKRNVKVLMVCREQDLKPEERTKIEQIPNIDLRFNERVHAKCFYNEQSMVITSLNLYNSSLGDNREMGILLRNDRDEDKTAFQEAKNEAEFIIRESLIVNSRPKVFSEEKSAVKQIVNGPSGYDRNSNTTQQGEKSIIKEISNFFGLGQTGFCIHCGKPIILNTDAPYCAECDKRWSKYKDESYKEKFCHECGHQEDTSMKRPLCYACFKKS